MTRFTARASLLLFATMSTTALAQSEDKIVIHPEVTEIDFNERHITATTDKPGLALVSEIKGAKFTSMIPLRKNFDDAVELTVDEVQ
jgi:hypothetical protein